MCHAPADTGLEQKLLVLSARFHVPAGPLLDAIHYRVHREVSFYFDGTLLVEKVLLVEDVVVFLLELAVDCFEVLDLLLAGGCEDHGLVLLHQDRAPIDSQFLCLLEAFEGAEVGVVDLLVHREEENRELVPRRLEVRDSRNCVGGDDDLGDYFHAQIVPL